MKMHTYDSSRIIIGIFGAIIGTCIIGIGIIHCHMNKEMLLMSNHARVPRPCRALITFGISVLVLTLCLFSDAIRNNKILKIIYILILFVLIILITCAATVLVMKREEYMDETAARFNVYWNFRNATVIQRFLDNLNVYLHCCGLENYNDYDPYPPPSCCGAPTVHDCVDDYYEYGCRSMILYFVKTQVNWIAGTAIAAAILFTFYIVNLVV